MSETRDFASCRTREGAGREESDEENRSRRLGKSVLRGGGLQCPRQGVRRAEHPSGTTGRERSVNTLGGSVKGGEGVER